MFHSIQGFVRAKVNGLKINKFEIGNGVRLVVGPGLSSISMQIIGLIEIKYLYISCIIKAIRKIVLCFLLVVTGRCDLDLRKSSA